MLTLFPVPKINWPFCGQFFLPIGLRKTGLLLGLFRAFIGLFMDQFFENWSLIGPFLAHFFGPFFGRNQCPKQVPETGSKQHPKLPGFHPSPVHQTTLKSYFSMYPGALPAAVRNATQSTFSSVTTHTVLSPQNHRHATPMLAVSLRGSPSSLLHQTTLKRSTHSPSAARSWTVSKPAPTAATLYSSTL